MKPTKNSEYDWEKFDSDTYVRKNYSWLREEDAQILHSLMQFVEELPADIDIIDVGIGPNLYPVLAVLQKARTIEGWDRSKKNIAYINGLLERDTLEKPWSIFWDSFAAAWPDLGSVDPIALLKRKFTAHYGSIYHLPKDKWDLAMMFFCAESCTSNMKEFYAAFDSFLGSIRPGGYFFSVLMENSEGYDVGNEHYPAVSISGEHVAEPLGKVTSNYVIERVRLGASPIRTGYSGMMIVRGRKAQK